MDEKPMEPLLIVTETLKLLKERRKGPRKWEDDKTIPPKESNAYAVLQAVTAYLHPQVSNRKQFAHVPLAFSEINEDIMYVVAAINKDSFCPSPYFTMLKVDFVDFASLTLTTLIDFANLYKEQEIIDESIDYTVSKAFGFLLESPYEDAAGMRWAGTRVSEERKKGFGHVYFTSLAMSALYYAINNYDFPDAEQRKARQYIEAAGTWLKNQFRDGKFYSDDRKTTGITLDLVSANYALNGLFRTWPYHRDDIHNVTYEGLKTFVSDLKSKREEFERTIWHTIPTERQGPQLYDDRTNIADCLSTLCLAIEAGVSSEIIDKEYFEFMTELYTDIITYKRDPRNKLWRVDEMRIYWTLSAIDALLAYQQYGTPEELAFSESEFREAIKTALNSDTVYYAVLAEARKIGRKRPLEI